MVQLVQSNLTLQVNNEKVDYKPNSLSYDLGLGEDSVKGVSGGQGSSSIAVSTNVETYVGMVKFELFTSDVNVELFREWKEIGRLTGNFIKIFDDNFQGTMVSARLTNKSEHKTGVDESFEVTFEGSQIK